MEGKRGNEFQPQAGKIDKTRDTAKYGKKKTKSNFLLWPAGYFTNVHKIRSLGLIMYVTDDLFNFIGHVSTKSWENKCFMTSFF